MSDGMARAVLETATEKDNGVARTPQPPAPTTTAFRQCCEETLEPAVRAAGDRTPNGAGRSASPGTAS